jgi:integrase
MHQGANPRWVHPRAPEPGRGSAAWPRSRRPTTRLRPGEGLGLKCSDVDLDSGRPGHRALASRPSRALECDGSCGRRAGSCPQRRNLYPVAAETKSRPGRRVVCLPAPLVELLRQHQADQDRTRNASLAGQLCQEGGWIFTTPTGRRTSEPMPSLEDRLREAGVRSVRLTTRGTQRRWFCCCSACLNAPRWTSWIGSEVRCEAMVMLRAAMRMASTMRGVL